MKKKHLFFILFFCIIISTVCLGYKTVEGILEMPESLTDLTEIARKPRLTDRFGSPLTVTYLNPWNSSIVFPLYEVPQVLQELFVFSEDKRFYEHAGVDWLARFHALWQNIISGKAVRGASTISEQVVRMIHPRPRTVWSRWLEGFEASRLEKKNTKDEIIEFYLNQVPYASNRRGIGQAAEYYFNRTPDTLSLREMMALTVLVRAPSYYDLYLNQGMINPPLNRFVQSLLTENRISKEDAQRIKNEKFRLDRPGLPVTAPHFARYVYSMLPKLNMEKQTNIQTTLDGVLQTEIQKTLSHALSKLSGSRVLNGACLVSDHTTGEILAWVSVGSGGDDEFGKYINAVLVPRQPGSSMKPFLYALALEKGWTAATLIDDTSLTNPVGRGLHTYHNYSRKHYGPVSLRNALGNSLNIPAIRAVRFTGVDVYLERLRELGIRSLEKHPDFYGDGLALGNGEITLFELVQAYNTLANRGILRLLSCVVETNLTNAQIKVYPDEVTSVIGNILSDPQARGLEFGSSSLLNFPVQTAVKTGTSGDYHDAWAVGYNHRYTVGIWMGNLNGRSMNGITGSTGPAMVLRSVFAELNQKGDTRPLYLSPRLVRKEICHKSDAKTERCVPRTEWFIPGTEPSNDIYKEPDRRVGFLKPVNGLEMAMDPRIPDEYEAFEFVIAGLTVKDVVLWQINGFERGKTNGGRYVWPLQKGQHVVNATIFNYEKSSMSHDQVTFTVK